LKTSVKLGLSGLFAAVAIAFGVVHAGGTAYAQDEASCAPAGGEVGFDIGGAFATVPLAIGLNVSDATCLAQQIDQTQVNVQEVNQEGSAFAIAASGDATSGDTGDAESGDATSGDASGGFGVGGDGGDVEIGGGGDKKHDPCDKDKCDDKKHDPCDWWCDDKHDDDKHCCANIEAEGGDGGDGTGGDGGTSGDASTTATSGDSTATSTATATATQTNNSDPVINAAPQNALPVAVIVEDDDLVDLGELIEIIIGGENGEDAAPEE